VERKIRRSEKMNPDCDICHGLGYIDLWIDRDRTRIPCECTKDDKKENENG